MRLTKKWKGQKWTFIWPVGEFQPPMCPWYGSKCWRYSDHRTPSLWHHGAHTFLSLLTDTWQVVDKWPFSLSLYLSRLRSQDDVYKPQKTKSHLYAAEKMIRRQYTSQNRGGFCLWSTGFSLTRVHLVAFTFEICWSHSNAALLQFS